MTIGSGTPSTGRAVRAATTSSGMVLGASLPLLAVAAALLIGAVMLVLLNADPVRAYGALIEGAFGSTVRDHPVAGQGDAAAAGRPGDLHRVPGQRHQHRRGGPDHPGRDRGDLVRPRVPHLAGLDPDPRRDHDRLPGRGVLGLRAGHPQGPAGGQRDPHHGHDERDRPAVHELHDPRPAHRSGRGDGRAVPRPVGEAARAGLAGAARPADAPARRDLRRARPGDRHVRLPVADHDRLPDPRRRARIPTRRATPGSGCRSTRRCR